MDTGAEPNILKIGNIDGDLMCNEDEKIKLSGITEETVTTYGSVTIDIHGYPVKFQLVLNSFPIPHGDILGSDFLQDTAKINYEGKFIEWHRMIMPFAPPKEITIPGRTSEICKISVSNVDVETRYVPRLEFGEGIFAGKAVVTNDHGEAYLRVFNTKETDVKLRTPTVTTDGRRTTLISPRGR